MNMQRVGNGRYSPFGNTVSDKHLKKTFTNSNLGMQKFIKKILGQEVTTDTGVFRSHATNAKDINNKLKMQVADTDFLDWIYRQ
ncbi:hypothetical protein SUGI_1203650 [Cryptomeria japonica]|nr:hypothetical protein SUGI_1203650 [Cryptomeria japonica]